MKLKPLFEDLLGLGVICTLIHPIGIVVLAIGVIGLDIINHKN